MATPAELRGLADALEGHANESDVNLCRSAADAIEELEQQVENHENCAADVRRLTRELDVALSGEDGAAKQASLCDLIHPAERLRRELSERLSQLALLTQMLRQFLKWTTYEDDFFRMGLDATREETRKLLDEMSQERTSRNI